MAEFTTAARLISQRGTARLIFIVLFGIWGAGGFILTFVEVMHTNSLGNVGVGQSAYVTMHLVWYLSGTVFLGLCALLSNTTMQFQRQSVEQSSPAGASAPRPSFRDPRLFPAGTTIYDANGVRLAVMPDYTVLVDDGAEGIRYSSADDYRKVAKDRREWVVTQQL